MSEIRVTTLKDTSGGNSSTTSQIYSGRAKAWAHFNGSGAVTLRASFNVNSIGDNGTGNYQINFSTAMVDANYAVSATTTDDNFGSTYVYVQGVYGGSFTPTTTDYRIYCFQEAAGPRDRTMVTTAVDR